MAQAVANRSNAENSWRGFWPWGLSTILPGLDRINQCFLFTGKIISYLFPGNKSSGCKQLFWTTFRMNGALDSRVKQCSRFNFWTLFYWVSWIHKQLSLFAFFEKKSHSCCCLPCSLQKWSVNQLSSGLWICCLSGHHVEIRLSINLRHDDWQWKSCRAFFRDKDAFYASILIKMSTYCVGNCEPMP